jgi:hypothetical protein
VVFPVFFLYCICPGSRAQLQDNTPKRQRTIPNTFFFS